MCSIEFDAISISKDYGRGGWDESNRDGKGCICTLVYLSSNTCIRNKKVFLYFIEKFCSSPFLENSNILLQGHPALKGIHKKVIQWDKIDFFFFNSPTPPPPPVFCIFDAISISKDSGWGGWTRGGVGGLRGESNKDGKGIVWQLLWQVGASLPPLSLSSLHTLKSQGRLVLCTHTHTLAQMFWLKIQHCGSCLKQSFSTVMSPSLKIQLVAIGNLVEEHVA